MKTFALNLIMLVLLISCASHNVVHYRNLTFDLEAQQDKVTQNGIELMIKPIHQTSELKAYFDSDLLIVAISLLVKA